MTTHVMRSLVLIVFARQGERTPYHGSGTLVLGPSGRLAILTAAHVVQPGDLVSLVTREGFVQDTVDEVVHAPERLDIALAFVREPLASSLRGLAIGPDRFETSTARTIPNGAQLVAAGFPEQFTFDARHPTHGWLQHRFVDIFHYTTDFNHDDRNISIVWESGHVIGDSFPYDELEVPRDAKVQFKKPNGLSGGPVYYIRSTRAGSLWSPSADATLIGIATEFTNRRELALPWWRWSDWVREALG
ncbi:MAG: serine protease [Kofleriaceae bacterium]